MTDLASRLREAKEGSRELDARVWCEANDCDFMIDVLARKAVAKSRAGKPLWHLGRSLMWLGWVDPGERLLNFTPLSDAEMPSGPIPAYTTDLSAAVALTRRVLPGWTIALIEQGANWSAEVRFSGVSTHIDWPKRNGDVSAPDPALALCLAILSAKEKANDRD